MRPFEIGVLHSRRSQSWASMKDRIRKARSVSNWIAIMSEMMRKKMKKKGLKWLLTVDDSFPSRFGGRKERALIEAFERATI